MNEQEEQALWPDERKALWAKRALWSEEEKTLWEKLENFDKVRAEHMERVEEMKAMGIYDNQTIIPGIVHGLMSAHKQ